MHLFAHGSRKTQFGYKIHLLNLFDYCLLIKYSHIQSQSETKFL